MKEGIEGEEMLLLLMFFLFMAAAAGCSKQVGCGTILRIEEGVAAIKFDAGNTAYVRATSAAKAEDRVCVRHEFGGLYYIQNESDESKNFTKRTP